MTVEVVSDSVLAHLVRQPLNLAADLDSLVLTACLMKAYLQPQNYPNNNSQHFEILKQILQRAMHVTSTATEMYSFTGLIVQQSSARTLSLYNASR